MLLIKQFSKITRKGGDIFMKPPLINDKPLSPVHFSATNGVHADLGLGREKVHLPFEGQTTLPTFRIGGSPSPLNDSHLADLGGTLKPPKP